MRTVFMGSDPIALPLLETLRQETELVGVFTQPDRPSGRGMKLEPNAIKRWALEAGLPVHQPERCGPADEAWLRAQAVACVVVMAYGQILKRSLLELPPLGVWNLHASLLPKLRGASPIQTAVATGETETGVSWMRIVPQLDAGPVMDVARVPIGPETTASAVWDALAAASPELARRCLARIGAGAAQTVAQDTARVTYCRTLNKEDAALDFNVSAQVLHDRIRGLNPWPGARLRLGEAVLKLGAARVVDRPMPEVPGTLLAEAGRLFVACGPGALELLQLQRPGGRMLPAADFLRGFALTPGTCATSEPMVPLVGPVPFPR